LCCFIGVPQQPWRALDALNIGSAKNPSSQNKSSQWKDESSISNLQNNNPSAHMNNLSSSSNPNVAIDTETSTMIAIKSQCEFVAEVVTVMTATADNMVRQAMAIRNSEMNHTVSSTILMRSEQNQESKSTISSMQARSKENQSSQLFSDAFSVYLRCMSMMRQVIEQAAVFKTAMSPSSHLQLQVSKLQEVIINSYPILRYL
jgi:MinD-like ATPase involved in chromosome partitioning or flagellar assembly